MATPAAIALVPVTASNWRAAMSLRVTPRQLPYVADHQPVAATALAKAHVGAMGHVWSPLLIQHGATPVGFLALTHAEADPAQAWLFHFFIDHHHQRHGHARAAMHATIALLRTRQAKRLNLLVNPANTPAQSLYLACGLAFTGASVEGDLAMTLALPTTPT